MTCLALLFILVFEHNLSFLVWTMFVEGMKNRLGAVRHLELLGVFLSFKTSAVYSQQKQNEKE